MELLPEAVGVDRFSDHHGGWGELYHAVVFVELGEVVETAAQEVGDAPASVALRADDVVHADLGEDLGVGIGVGFGPDIVDTEVNQVGGGQDGRLQAGADTQDDSFYLVDAELHQGLLVGGVADGGIGKKAGAFLNQFGIGIHAKDFHAVAGEFLCQ